VIGGTCRPQKRHALDTLSQITMESDLVWYIEGRPARP